MQKYWIAGAAAACMLGVVADAAHADVLYQQALSATIEGGPFSSDPHNLYADRFSLTHGGTVDQVSWYGLFQPGRTHDGFSITFWNGDSSGYPAGALQQTITASATQVDTGLISDGLTVYLFSAAVPDITFAAATYYWVSVGDINGDVAFRWSFSDVACCSSEQQTIGSWYTNQTPHAFSLEGEAPPPPGGVPEPATWAMMIVGFGLVGSALRRRIVATA